MKEYICKKDFYLEDVKFSSVGDHVVLLTDGSTIVNKTGGQKVANYPDITKDSEYFTKTFETKHDNISNIENKDERVNHPSHYTWLKEKCGIEVIDITRHLDFSIGNAFKYLLRAGHKLDKDMSSIDKTIEDLQKAIWYINDKIKQLNTKRTNEV